VHQNVGVGVAIEPFVMGEFNAAQDELSARDERVDIIANADMHHHCRLGEGRERTKHFIWLLLAFHRGRGKSLAMNRRILFVDDETAILEMLSVFFRDKGYDITSARSAHEAMALADQGFYDLTILDINLAGENGLELLGYFRANFPKLPVVMFTGLAEDDLLDQAMARGASGFMKKTDSLTDLLAAVQVYAPRA
jgi:CheY-like chemotaxis protein